MFGTDLRRKVETHLSKVTLEKVHEIGEVVVTVLAHTHVGQVLIYHVVKGKFIFIYDGQPLYFSYFITISSR